MGSRLRTWWRELPEADKGILAMTALLLAIATVIAVITLTGLPGDPPRSLTRALVTRRPRPTVPIVAGHRHHPGITQPRAEGTRGACRGGATSLPVSYAACR